MFKRVISACMAVVLTSTAFFNVSKNDSVNTISTNETTITQTSRDIIISEEAFTEAGIIIDEVSARPEKTEKPDEETITTTEQAEEPAERTASTRQTEAATETPEKDASDEAATTEPVAATKSEGDAGTSEGTAAMKPAGDDGAVSASTQTESTDIFETATTEAEDMQHAETTDLPETDVMEIETELYAASGSCTVKMLDSYSALGAPGHTFSAEIDGVKYSAVCCDSSKGSTDEHGAAYNLDGLVTKDPSNMIYKTMYYSYVGPEPWSGFSDTAEAVVATARNLSYYMNNDGEPGNYYYKWLKNDAPTPPAHTFSLSSTDASLSDVMYQNKTYQGSNWITLSMDERLTAELDAPSDVIILLKDKKNNVTKKNGANGIKIKGGESFQVLGDKSLSGNKKVSLHYDGDKMILVYGLSPADNSYLQRLLYIDREHPSASITFKFEGEGALQIDKKSSDESVTKNNDCYSFEGIEYSLYADGKKQVLATFVMNKKGQGAVGEITAAGEAAGISKGGTYLLKLPLGNYDVKETKTNGHYNMDTKVYDVAIKEVYDKDNPKSVHVETYSNTPKMDPVVISLEKQNEEGDTVKGAADLEGAQYTIKYYNGNYNLNNLPATATRTWVIQTIYNSKYGIYECRLNERFKIFGDAFYLDENKIPSLPHGTITIQETKAPAGYKLDGAKLYLTGASAKDNPNIEIDGDIILAKITDEGLNIRVNSSNSVDADSASGINILQTEEMIRGDFAFTKKDYRTGEGMAYIPFLIESKTTGEKHVVCTDENGAFSTAASFKKHSDNTNGNDALMNEALIGDIQPYGVWFYGNDKAESSTGADDTRGALPYDSYIVTELLCERNRDYQLAEPFEVTINAEGVMPEQPELVNVPKPELKTTAWTGTKDNHAAKLGPDVILTDTCEYSYLTAGATYTIHSVMVDAAGNPVKDASGKYIEAAKEFTVEDAYNVSRYEKCGSIDISCTVNATNLAGFTGTFFEYVSLGDTSSVSIIDANGHIDVTSMDVVAEHADLTDTSQQIEFTAPSIKTTLVNKETGSKYAIIKKDVQLADRVSYTNLADGKYVLSGVLMNKKTGLPVTVAGSEVTASAEFEISGNPDGTAPVTYSFDGTKAGLVNEDGTIADVVCFEKLYIVDGKKKILIAAHEDINDMDQTVCFTYIKTYAGNKADGSKEIKAGDKEVTVTDTVSYFNLEPGKYVISGYLMDRAANKPLTINGEKIIVTKTFESDASGSGTVDVDYTFVTSAVMEGKGSKDIVVFEELYLADAKTLVCEHKDIDDEDQTVHVSDQPKTGDMNNPSVIFSIAVLCLLGIILLIKNCRKKYSRKCNK